MPLMLTWVKHILSGAREPDRRQRWWKARVAALEQALGKCDNTVFFAAGYLHRQGFADVLRFHDYVKGTTYVTCGLIGNEKQVPNRWGHYELMMCTRRESEWAPDLLSRLARYTYDATLQPGDTMDIGEASRPDSVLSALLFARPAPPADSFDVLGTPANLILAIGITASEFTACKNFGSGVMLRMLKEKGIYPYTDLDRESVT